MAVLWLCWTAHAHFLRSAGCSPHGFVQTLGGTKIYGGGEKDLLNPGIVGGMNNLCLLCACFVLVQSISFLFCQVCWLDSKTFFPAYFTYHLTKSAGEISPKSAATPKRLQVSPHAALAWLAPAPPRRCGGVSSRRVRGNWWNGASLVGMIYLQLGATLYNWVIIIYQWLMIYRLWKQHEATYKFYTL